MNDNHSYIKQKPNAVSPDFPFRTIYGNISQQEHLPKLNQHSPSLNLRTQKLNQYNNELPDIFRLDSMTHSHDIYNNPYLNDVIPVDRKELYKNIERSRKNIRLIDKLKYNIKLSQNPMILSNIKNEYAHNLNKSKSQHTLVSPLELSKIELTKETNENKYIDTVLSLYKNNSPKIGFRLKHQIDSSNYLQLNDKFLISKKNEDKVNKLKSIVDEQHSAYLGNINNYDIKENYNENKKCKFEFNRKKITIYNPITNQKRQVQPDIIYTDKWDKYSENFALLKHNLKRKGGYFSEFAKKNKSVFNMIQIQAQMKEHKKQNKHTHNLSFSVCDHKTKI